MRYEHMFWFLLVPFTGPAVRMEDVSVWTQSSCDGCGLIDGAATERGRNITGRGSQMKYC